MDGKGVEFSTEKRWKDYLKVRGNFTFQSNKITTPPLAAGGLQGAQVPNIPNLFYNTGISYELSRHFYAKGKLEFVWNYFFIFKYSINEVKDLSTAKSTFIVPTQHLHNTGLVYTPANIDFDFSLNVRNVFNSKIYDNFRIPRPGINFSFKINYSI